MAKNLFAKAKDSGVKKDPNSKEKKVRISVKSVDFFKKVEKLEELQDNMKRDKAIADMISDEIRDISRTEWINLYQKTGKNPGSVMIESKHGLDVSQLMFVPTDAYIKINAERSEQLIEQYGPEIVEEKTVFSFDADMIEKYGEALSKLIEECSEIDEDDKGSIIKATTSYSVAKGTIDKLKEYGDVAYVMESVRPIVALKNIEVLKG